MKYIPGRALPNNPVRPFTALYSSIDEKQLRSLSPTDKTNFIAAFMYICVIAGIGAFIVWFALDFTSDIDLVISVTAFLIAGLIYLLLKFVKPKQYVVFDRENQTISYPVGTFSKKMFTAPWDEWGARVTIGATYSGGSRHSMWLVHLPSERLFPSYSSVAGIDFLLGIWSFIIQFMDKNGPYPNVPGLDHLDNLTDGLGTWDDWEKNGIAFTSEDPYYTWLEEQKS